MERRKFLKTTGAVGVGAAIAGCSGFGGTNGTDGGPEGGNDDFDIVGEIADDSADQLKFQDVDLYRLVDSGDNDNDIFGNEDEGAGVRGQLKNTADNAYQSVEVEVTLYDESDDVLGEWFDNTEEEDLAYLNPGSTWGFNVVFEGADIGQAARYTVSAEGNLQSGDGNGTQNETQNDTQNGTAETTTQS